MEFAESDPPKFDGEYHTVEPGALWVDVTDKDGNVAQVYISAFQWLTWRELRIELSNGRYYILDGVNFGAPQAVGTIPVKDSEPIEVTFTFDTEIDTNE